MKTFEEIKNNIRASKTLTMQRAMKELEREDLQDFEKDALNKVIQNSQNCIDNIDEVTVIEIGSETNSLIHAIQKAYKLYLNEYWSNFDKFMNEYVIGLTEEGNLKNGAYFGQSECYLLGVGINELSCFKGKDPMHGETEDIFRQIVNTNCGTNIPKSGEVMQALHEYEAVAFGDDEMLKAKAFVKLKELQENAGDLRNGAYYYTLANNETYQQAKAICVEKNL